ncbi:MAG: hypothetical protein RJA98_3225 [Pseudomonadota bacterium]|jgi:4-amino-4-deoxy-L-arabinose transferase-like glycosyltransferase
MAAPRAVSPTRLAILNTPNPALVSHRAAQRLPRWALLLFCLAYVLPGVFGRDPWKSADITAFGTMANMAQGKVSWLAPTVAGLPTDGALLPYWIGGVAIKLLGGVIDPALAARLPFALVLVLVLALTWYATFHLARTDAAQPLPFAFGGEASPSDYARAVADGALLALIATLGLLQLGHETTPELLQLAGVALLMYGLAARATPGRSSLWAVLLALPILAASTAPTIALLLGATSVLVCWRSRFEPVRALVPWVLLSTALAAGLALFLGEWHWRVGGFGSLRQALAILRQLAWFTWPTWPLALWTLWRWRRHLTDRHISIPLSIALVNLGAGVLMGGYDRALLLALPALAVLASFALPTLQRSAAAAIDWFSVFFFSTAAIILWVVYVAMQTGIPKQPAANVAKLAPGFVAHFSALPLMLALAGSFAWIWLVGWRTNRQRHPLWKSMVLPASGVALAWLLLMTLWLPLLDYALSYRPLVQRLAQQLPPHSCVAAPGMARAELVALEYLGGWRVDAATPLNQSRCEFWLQVEPRKVAPAQRAGWRWVGEASRPTDRADTTRIYRREPGAHAN